jgi:cytidine deaminase
MRRKHLRTLMRPYSGFAVGAAVGTRSGRIFRGANLENSAYGASTCAEIAALANANTVGDFDVEAIAIVGYSLDPPPRGRPTRRHPVRALPPVSKSNRPPTRNPEQLNEAR